MLTRPSEGRHDEGTTLVELIVTMTIVAIFFSIFGVVSAKVFDSSRSQQARSVNLDVNRNVVQVLDRQVRYANAINLPSTSNGSEYVEWQTGSAGKVQTCYQWRVTGAGVMEHRSWTVATAGSSTATAWKRVGSGVRPAGETPIFSTAQPVALGSSRQQLAVVFRSTSGTPPVDTEIRSSLTALNTTTPFPPATDVCKQALTNGDLRP